MAVTLGFLSVIYFGLGSGVAEPVGLYPNTKTSSGTLSGSESVPQLCFMGLYGCYVGFGEDKLFRV